MTRPDHQRASRGIAARPAVSRTWLLSGVSLLGLLGAALPPGARAGQPPLFSPQWMAQRTQAMRSAVGAGTGGAVGVATPGAPVGTPTVQAKTAQSVADLGKMAAAIRQAQAVQAQAVQAATAGNVPNGLVRGGLQVAPTAGTAAGATLWVGADLPTQTAAGGRTAVTVTQTQPQALLTWQSFNVGANTTLAFDQASHGGGNAANWVALNRVTDPALQPSRILGSVTAPGKVFVINPNGIIFGAGAQVNVGALLASAADLPSSITAPASASPGVSYTLYGAQSGSGFAPSLLGAPASSTIEVDAGARITTALPASATEGGGYAMLLGGTVRNAGAITTPFGQTVLAAGQDFVLRPGTSTSGNQTATVRGSQVASVGAGSVSNDGILTATDGDVTLVGHSIVQNGVALASTSVNLRGTVHLLGATRDATATITLAPGSLTAVQPDDSTDTALNSQRAQLIAQSGSLDALRLAPASKTNPQLNDVGTLADRLDLSRIEITTGGSVEFAAGSLTMAQGGQVAVQAAGRVQADSAAAIDVSGQVGVSLPMSANNLVISVQSFEQRDAPVNRLSGSLDSRNVTVDVRDLVLVPASTLYPTDRYYTPGGLLEVSGYLNTTGHTIGEWSAVGGTITLAGAAVVAQTASVFNVAGGSLSYQAGMLGNSYLIGADGALYNANTAPAAIRYTGIYDGFVSAQPRWNVSQTFLSPLLAPAQTYQAGYDVGRDGGSLVISAPTAIFEGAVSAGVVNGAFQSAARPAGVTDAYALAQNVVALPGSLSLGKYDASGLAGAFPTAVTFAASVPALADQLGVATPIPTDRRNTAEFSTADLDAAGLGGIRVASLRPIRVTDGLTLAPGGAVSLVAPTVDLAGGITVPAGRVAASSILTVGATRTALGGAKGLVVLEPGATIDTRGLWTNALLDPTGVTNEAFVNGGSVTLDSAAALRLALGSVIDASSGAALLAGGKVLNGKGGSVAVIGDDPGAGHATAAVLLGGTIRAYGGAGGGTLQVVARSLLLADAPPASTASVWLAPDFFTHGFTTYDLNGLTGVSVASATVIAPVAPVYQLDDASGGVPTGNDPSSALRLWLPPLYIEDPRHAVLTQRQGVSLLLRADANIGTAAARGGPVTLGDGALIAVDPGQTVRLEGYGQVSVLGTIAAPGGSIAIVNTRTESPTIVLSPSFVPGLSVWLGPASRVTTAAQAAVAADALGRPYGVVPAGGTIALGSDIGLDPGGTVKSTDALVILRPGAVIDASGASAVLDSTAGSSALGQPLLGAGGPAVVGSAAGTIALSSFDGIYLDGTLRAAAGAPGAGGGTLSLTVPTPLYSSNAAKQPTQAERTPRTILVSQATISDLGTDARRPGQATPASVGNHARISVAQIAAGGFDNVSLFAGDLITFDGDVALSLPGSLRLSQGIIAESDPAGRVALSAPYVRLDGYSSSYAPPDGAVQGLSVNGTAWRPDRLATTATLGIAADLIDLADDMRFGVSGSFTSTGTLASGQPRKVAVNAAGFAAIDLASAGDIRFSTGTFVTPGSVSFSAAQLYPTTRAQAGVYAGIDYYGARNANVYDTDNAITVTWNGVVAAAPYSVGGTLLLAAPTIDQGGVLRAPQGNIVLGAAGGNTPANAPSADHSFASLVTLRPGSITSVSLDGRTLPFGGTADGLTYSYNGNPVFDFAPAVTLAAQSVAAQAGATLDLGGGGELAGAAFQTGRGGSVDTLLAPLPSLAAGGASLAAHPVYAIVPNFGAAYAPITPLDQSGKYQGSVPSVGAQITLAGVPGLAAGTYTLLPSYYALLPGAFRVQLDTTTHAVLANPTPLPDGSFVVGGYRGTARTAASVVPVPVTLTPGSVVRSYSQYDEQSYSQFQFAAAARTGAPRGSIPADAKALALQYPAVSGALPALSYAGVSDFAPAPGGYGSTVAVLGGGGNTPDFEITGAGATPTPGLVSLSAADLDALGAARLIIGGSAQTASIGGVPTLQFKGQAASVVVRGGATLAAPEVFLVADAGGQATGALTVEAGATIDTIGAGAAPYDSDSGTYYNAAGNTVLAASNGRLVFTPDVSTSRSGAITVADGAVLYAAGTLNFATRQSLTLGPQASFGAKYISLDVASLDILSDAVQAAASTLTLPAGLQLSQAVLDRLLSGDPAHGVPAVAELTLTATQSVNLFGGVTLSTAAGGLQQLVLNTPAIYGWSDASVGGTSEVARIDTGSGALVWNGIAATVPAGPGIVAGSALPGGFADTGLGSGTGTLDIVARQIVLGYPANAQVDNQTSLDRIIVGFADVILAASEQIVGNNHGSLAVYQTPASVFGQPGSGGNLALATPLLTGQAGAITRITAGGALALVAPAGVTPGPAAGLGAEIDLIAQAVSLDGAVALPSGKLAVAATGGIALGPSAAISVAGSSAGFFDQTRDLPGGTVGLQTASGDVTQAAGGTIDLSAGRAAAGTLTVGAAAGTVSLAGVILGGAASGEATGSIAVRAGTLADFGPLNQRLTQGGVTGGRAFEIGSGDLTIGNEIVAGTVRVALDHGSLTVAGTIEAAGLSPGSIDLSASGDLTLASGAVLDAHATLLHTDSQGVAIDASNTPQVTLTSIGGTLALQAAVTIDVSSADGIARGKLALNAPRVGADDIAISAAGPLTLAGVWTAANQPAGSVAVYGWRSYQVDADATSGVALVTQTLLDSIDAQDTQPFMAAAAANPALQLRLQPLQAAAQGAFHLRPGVELDSAAAGGGMAVSGDLNLANYRYGPDSAEPGALVLRASGGLAVNGSVTDGFGTPADGVGRRANPDDNGWVLFSGLEPFSADVVLPENLPGRIVLGFGTTIPTNNAVALNYPITIARATLNAGVVIPARVQLAPPTITSLPRYVIPAGGWVATAPITDAGGIVQYAAGAIIPAGTILQSGWFLGAGSVLPFQVAVPSSTVWPAGASLQAFADPLLTLLIRQRLPPGAFIPSGTTINFVDFSSQQNLRDATTGSQGQIWAIAPMLPPGSLSWSIGLVSGADTASADRFAVRPAGQPGGDMVLSDLHYTAPDQGAFAATPAFSVIRTGTGDLTLRAGGDITQDSLWGIYTAGSQSAGVDAAFELPQAAATDGTLFGRSYQRSYDQFGVNYQAYYPTGGGNVVVAAGGGVYGDVYANPNALLAPSSDLIGNWLWRQGNAADQPAAWWINFGSYVLPFVGGNGQSGQPALVGFVGIGTLGGGNLTVAADGDAGVTVGRDSTQRSEALVLAVASTGRVTGTDAAGGVVTGGTLLETGGGSLQVRVGGALNGLAQADGGIDGDLIDLRGAITVAAGSLGRVAYRYNAVDPVDPRPLSPFVATVATEQGGITVVPGDGAASIATRGDLVLGGAADAGRVPTQDQPGFSYVARDGSTAQAPSGAQAAFSLWTPATAISLLSIGGNLTPTTQPVNGALGNAAATDGHFVFPPTLEVVAASGSIYYGALQPGVVAANSPMAVSLELAPSPIGQLDFLARGSIYAAGYAVDMSGAPADADSLANPFRPLYIASAAIRGFHVDQTNEYAGAAGAGALFAFGPDTPAGNLHAGDTQPMRFYADGDIVDVRSGEILNFTNGATPSTWYLAAKPVWMLAGQDIVAAGTRPAFDPATIGAAAATLYPNQAATAVAGAETSGNLILNNGPADISVVAAGRDILTSYVYVAGPGLLSVQAGRNVDLRDDGILKSLGPITGITGQSRDGGAGIAVLAGAGAAGPDTADFARRYFDPANVADPAFALDAPQNQGRVARSYADELLAWLAQTVGYTGGQDGALAAFLALPDERQQQFVRTSFFAELLASGREETNPDSVRYHSYLRGKDAIATLFPAASYTGALTMFSGTLRNAAGDVIASAGQPVVFDAGISTQFGGDIQVLTPGGEILLGAGGNVAPGSNTGLVTFGSGAIEAFARDSVLLGQSRVFTTFGGNIQIWSATGDINAGIGTKTSVVYQPPLVSYDALGGITLAPTAPTNGAGIATLTSIPGVPAGDVDLVAPQGTIDAGEAGIRVSGNLTLAALSVVNAANLQVAGKTAGAPVVAVSNVAALNAGGAAAASAENTASNNADEQRRKRQAAQAAVVTVDVLGYGE